jgi:hypothetical protein
VPCRGCGIDWNDKNKGESIVLRRCITLAGPCSFVFALALAPVGLLFAQNAKQVAEKAAVPPPAKAEVQKEAAKPDAPKTAETAKPQEPTKDATKTAEPPKATEPPLPPIPPDVQAKIDAARKAVAEMIVAAQDAGLVETSIDPPPILDLLINGRATDSRTLKGAKPFGVSPEVFGAWFTGFGKTDGINYVEDLRIMNPSAGLKQWYEQRARILEQYIQEIRKTKPAPAKKEDAKPAEATKPAEAKKAEIPKPAEKKQ